MLYLTDFHSHVLPRLDDGSKSIEESYEMLKRMGAQGVKRVVASPHFYANDQGVDEFLEKRAAAYAALSSVLGQNLPQLALGAELRYYEGVSRLEGLLKLCIQGTPLLLLEMPERRWGEYVLRELTSLACRGDLRIVLAHVERCIPFQSPATVQQLVEAGVLMQLNAEAFKGFFEKRRALKLLKQGKVQFIGSDTHNLTDRAPNIDIATESVRNKLGEEFLQGLVSFGNSFFDK